MPQPSTRSRFQRFAAALSFALWWGGLTIYISIVVPIGTEVLSSTEQGFVTQRVTHWLNILAALWLAFSFLESKAHQRLRIVWIVQLVLLGALVPLHWRLDTMLDASSLSVIDGARFYNTHRLYLWLTTAQWAAGIAHAWLFTSPLAGGGDSSV